MKKAIAVVVVAGVLLSGWLVYARYEARLAEAKAAQAKRDAAYEGVLTQVRKEVSIGTPQSELSIIWIPNVSRTQCMETGTFPGKLARSRATVWSAMDGTFI
jgi:hypothetical protein